MALRLWVRWLKLRSVTSSPPSASVALCSLLSPTQSQAPGSKWPKQGHYGADNLPPASASLSGQLAWRDEVLLSGKEEPGQALSAAQVLTVFALVGLLSFCANCTSDRGLAKRASSDRTSLALALVCAPWHR